MKSETLIYAQLG